MRHDTGRRMGGNTFADPTALVSRLETEPGSDTLAAMNLPLPLARGASSSKRARVRVRRGKHPRIWARCRWSLLIGVTVGSCLFPALLASAGNLVLVKKGQPKAEIVVGEEPAPPTAFAARELQRYVKEMSGAELPIVTASSKRPAVALVSLKRDIQLTDDLREADRYRLNVDARILRIEGANPRAVLFGVYDILERLGCGWCVPGDDVVPKRDTLELTPLHVDTRPAFQYRMMLDFPMLRVAQTIAIADWLAKNRMNWVRECPNAHGEPTAWYERRDRVIPELKKRGLRLIVGGHTMHTWVPETHFASHPEWFAYDGGARKPPTLCVSNPEMAAELIRNMQRFLDRCPEVDVIDLWHTDSEVFCHCATCVRGVATEGAKEKPPADAVQSAYVISYIEFVNRVAGSIAKSHPTVMIGPLIYSQTDRAMPDGCPAPADNVLLGLAHFLRDSYRPLVGEPKSAINLRLLGNDLTWMAKSRHSYIYEYYNCWIAPYIYPGAQVIVRDLQTLETLQIQGVSSDMYGYSPVNMYVAARGLWSPNISWKAAVREFCLRYYGDVGEAMAENELRLETGIFGLNGYQASGARDPEKWSPPPTAGLYLQQQRPAQIKFLNQVIAKTRDPRVRARLERALKPWSLWNKEPRFWAFPEFKDSNER
jgi:hypothetical protein